MMQHNPKENMFMHDQENMGGARANKYSGDFNYKVDEIIKDLISCMIYKFLKDSMHLLFEYFLIRSDHIP